MHCPVCSCFENAYKQVAEKRITELIVRLAYLNRHDK